MTRVAPSSDADARPFALGRPCSTQPSGLPDEYDFELVLVSFHSRTHIERQLEELPPELPVVIADNASNADGVREVLAGRAHARYVDTGGGKGYAKASNLAACTSPYEYLVFGNPDTRPDVGTLTQLVDAVRREPSLASCAALTVNGAGRIELGVGGWEPTLGRVFVHALGLHLLFPRAGLFAKPSVGELVSLDWLSAPCMAVRRDTFLNLGGWDERYFVYNEDMAFGRQARDAGLKQMLRTDLLVPHGDDSGAGATAMLRLRGASMAAYLRHHNSLPLAAVMRFLLVVGSVLRIAKYRARGQRERSSEFAAYIKGLLVGYGFET